MYVCYANIFSTPKGILIRDIHCIRHAGYKKMQVLRTLYAIPNDVITSIHCTIKTFVCLCVSLSRIHRKDYNNLGAVNLQQRYFPTATTIFWFSKRKCGVLTSLDRYLRNNSHRFHIITLKFHLNIELS